MPATGRARLTATDKFFAALRLATIAVGAAWLLLTPQLQHRRQLVGLFSAFLLYTLLIYGLILLTRWPVVRFYLFALAMDLFFLFWLVRWTGGVTSVFVVSFYLLVGLHSFYFGARPAMLIATLAAAGEEGRTVPVRLRAHVTELGTLELWCVAREGGRRWKIEFNLRQAG